ncbi:MAG: hypothetical protein IJV70_05025, partial [Clostridia bacterium]|nr:hypothetical protein [Clostridia bacterium]
HLDLVEGAKKIGAILFRKDMVFIEFKNWLLLRWKKRALNFYLISEDETEKLRHAEGLVDKYKYIKNTKLYLFSNNIESIKFLDSLNAQRAESKEIAWKIKVLRINDIRSLVYQNLSEHGIELFENATRVDDVTREISAAIIGLGKYGIEVMKALLWYCQIPGYRVRIHAFDEKEDIVDRIKAICPEINIEGADNDTPGDMRYTVTVENASFGTEKLYEKIKDHKLTYLFVCLGNDRQNITAATELRNRLLKSADKPDVSKSPRIETVVYDSLLKKRIEKDLRSQNIEIIGDLDSFYSVETVINSTLITKGLDVHKRWSSEPEKEIDYYMNDYNFYSSLASAMHRSLRESIIAYDPNVKEEKEKEAKKKEVFPFYYSDGLDKSKFNVGCEMKLLRELLNQINDNKAIIELSNELNEVADLLYIKMARLKYESLNEADRKAVIADVSKFMEKKKIKAYIPMLSDPNDLGGYDDCLKRVAFDKDIHKVSRRIFDSIIAVKTKDMVKESKLEYVNTLEYENLDDTAKDDVLEYIKAQMEKNDFAYIKIAYLKYKELLPEKRKSDMKKLEEYLEEKKYTVNVSMINDATNYISGYDACLKKAYDDKVIKDVLRNMLDFIIEAETETEEKFKVEERFTHENLSDEERKAVEDYAGSRTVPFGGIEAYFEKAKAVAYIEHIRWNA